MNKSLEIRISYHEENFNPWFWVILAYKKCWYNTGNCGWEATYERAAKAAGFIYQRKIELSK